MCEKIVENIHNSDSVSMIDEIIENICIVVSKNKDIYESLTTQIVIHDDLGNESTKDYLHRLSKSKPKMFSDYLQNLFLN